MSRYTIDHPKSPWTVERFGVVLERWAHFALKRVLGYYNNVYLTSHG